MHPEKLEWTLVIVGSMNIGYNIVNISDTVLGIKLSIWFITVQADFCGP